MTRDLLAGRHVEIKGCRELRADEISAAIADRFRARLRRTASGCLIWTGATNADGYGVVRIAPDRLVLAHRLAIALALGVCPRDRVGDHFRCRTPACCELEHLRLATLEENSPGLYGFPVPA